MDDAQFYIQIGTVIGGLAGMIGTVKLIWAKLTRLEEAFDAKLNNGIRSEITAMKVDIATIIATMDRLPKRSTD